MAAVDDFLQRLSVGPAVLLLGQGYLSLDVARDPIIDLVAAKYGVGPQRGYSAIFEGSLASERQAAIQWVDERSSRLPRPPWLSVVSSFAWSALCTSAIDSLWIEAFRSDWRGIRPIYEELQRPDQPRNKLDLVSMLLFGSARWHELVPVPTTPFELRARQGVATSLVRRIPELVTPRGVLAIEGYGEDDWLTPEIFLPILDGLGESQAHVFSASEAFRALEDVQYLESRSRLVVHEESLAAVMQRGFDSGLLRKGSPLSGAETGHRIELRTGALDIPRETWRRVTRSSYILEDDVLRDPRPLSPASRYQAYRRFLESSDGKPDWHAYSRGFAFKRDFEDSLRDKVDGRLRAKQLQDAPVIVHGGTGAGKTVALAHLAHALRHERENPVLFIPRRIRPPALDDIEAFVRWAETAGAPATLIVWDAMSSYGEYLDLSRLLVSRGRKAVVVGSLYKQDTTDPNHIEVPRNLVATETHRFDAYLKSIDPDLARAAPKAHFTSGADFLVSLFRLLPPSRMQLRQGVSRELGFAEIRMSKLEQTQGVVATPRTAMEHALLDAGLISPADALLTQEAEVGGERVQVVQKLTALIMVPGQFGLAVPLELLLRSLGKEGYQNFVQIMEGADILQWEEDDAGNIDIAARTALEAQIVTQGRLGGTAGEIDVVCSLIESVVVAGVAQGGNREAEFASRLAQAIGGPQADSKYASHLNRVAAALGSLRTERSIKIPELMLQEAHLLREWTKAVEVSREPVERLGALESAQEVLEEALEEEQDRYKHSYLRVNLLTELAAAHSFTASLQVKAFKDVPSALESFASAKVAIADARMLTPDNYYPLDVLAWSTMDLAKAGALSEDVKTDAIADLIGAFETADLSDSSGSSDQILRRRQEIGQLFGNAELEDEAYAALKSRGSTSGIILRSMKLAGGPRQEDWASITAMTGFEFAVSEASQLASGPDQRLRELLLNLWWCGRTGERIFARERVALAFTAQDWRKVVSLVQPALASGQSTRSVKLRFLFALAEFHLGGVPSAMETLRDVEQESHSVRSRWNVVRSYVASRSDGSPQTYNGLIADVFDGGMRGEVFVEGLQKRIQFRARDFGNVPFSNGDALPPFHIGFSFQGAIADPVSAYRLAREREKAPSKGPRPRRPS